MHRLPEAVQESIESSQIPSPPEILLRLLRTVDDEQATMADLAGIVGKDPGLASRILGVANSPALRRGRELKDIDTCLIALGTRLIRSLATCLAIQLVSKMRYFLKLCRYILRSLFYVFPYPYFLHR